MARKKTWQEQLHDSKDLHKIIEKIIGPNGKGALHYGDRMLVPSPLYVDALMKSMQRSCDENCSDAQEPWDN